MIKKDSPNYLENIFVILLGVLAMWYSGMYKETHDPIVLILTLVVYMELSKLLYMALVGIQTPILLRYVVSAVLVGALTKTYIMMAEKDIVMMFVYLAISGAMLFLRGVAWNQTNR